MHGTFIKIAGKIVVMCIDVCTQKYAMFLLVFEPRLVTCSPLHICSVYVTQASCLEGNFKNAS